MKGKNEKKKMGKIKKDSFEHDSINSNLELKDYLNSTCDNSIKTYGFEEMQFYMKRGDNYYFRSSIRTIALTGIPNINIIAGHKYLVKLCYGTILDQMRHRMICSGSFSL